MYRCKTKIILLCLESVDTFSGSCFFLLVLFSKLCHYSKKVIFYYVKFTGFKGNVMSKISTIKRAWHCAVLFVLVIGLICACSNIGIVDIKNSAKISDEIYDNAEINDNAVEYDLVIEDGEDSSALAPVSPNPQKPLGPGAHPAPKPPVPAAHPAPKPHTPKPHTPKHPTPASHPIAEEPTEQEHDA